MKHLMACALALIACSGFSADKKIAVFAQNKTTVVGMEEAVPAIRERLVAAFSEVEDFQVVDSTLASAAFSTAPNVAAMAGCDYAAVATVIGATAMHRLIGGKPTTVYTLRMTLKITDSDARSVDGMPMWSRQLPIQEAVDEPIVYYQMLMDQWSSEVTQIVAQKAPRWRVPSRAEQATFVVSTTIDNVKEEFESRTKGVKGEQLQELRKVVGGAAVELDGVLVGTAPCELRASAGLHKLRVTRQWMKTYEATVNVTPGLRLEIALELNDEGAAKWGTIEAVRSSVARDYTEAAWRRGIKFNVDTRNWRDVGLPPTVKVETK